MNKRLWKQMDSSARARIKEVGNKPTRISPYCSLKYVGGIFRGKEEQAWLNYWAMRALVLRGGVWEDTDDQGF